MSVFSDVKKALKRIGQLDNRIGGAFTDLGKHWHRMDRIDWFIRKELDEVRGDIGRVAGKVEDEVEEAIVEKLPDLIEDAAKKVAREASELAIEEVLDNAADVIEIMAPDEFTLVFGMELALVVQGEVTVSFSFPNPVSKLTEIRAWAEHPPKGRAKIIECIRDFGPTSLSAEFKVSGNGLSAEWDGDEKYDRIDAFLEKHGVK